jgi:hypothetical protein
VETDAAGDIHLATFVRRRGRVGTDATLDGSPLHDNRTPAHRLALTELLGDLTR